MTRQNEGVPPRLPRAGQDGRLAPPWFNVVEGLVDHHLLRIHKVRDDVASPLAWDLGFLAFGLILVAVGTVLPEQRRPGRPPPPPLTAPSARCR